MAGGEFSVKQTSSYRRQRKGGRGEGRKNGGIWTIVQLSPSHLLCDMSGENWGEPLSP
jgi:hypothetical protein